MNSIRHENTTRSSDQNLTPVFDELAKSHEQYIRACSGSVLPGEVQALPTTLQAFAANFFTGKVEFFNKQGTVQFYFDGGRLVDARLRSIRGDSAVREAISWLVGVCTYNTEQRSSERTISRHLQSLIREGFVLLDQKRFLNHYPLYYESILRQAANSKPSEVKKNLAEIPRRIYAHVDGSCTLTDIIRDLELETWEWVPAIFHLLEMEAIGVDQARSKDNALASLSGAESVALALDAEMRSPHTGLYTHEGLLIYLQRELKFFYQLKKPLSLFVMEMEGRPTGAAGGKSEFLPNNIVSEISRRFSMLLKPIDIFAHFESNEFALLLPNTTRSQAEFLAERIRSALASFHFNLNNRPFQVNLHCGIATLPEIGSDMHALLSAAGKAKMAARTLQLPIEIAFVHEAPLEKRDAINGGAKTSSQANDKSSLDLKEILVGAEVLTEDQVDQACALMSRMPIPFTRVLAMEGQVREETIGCAEQLCKMVEENRLSAQQAIQALSLVAHKHFGLDTALKRFGIADEQREPDAVGELLFSAGLITTERLSRVTKQSTMSELPAETILICTGVLPRTIVRAALRLVSRINAKSLSQEQAVEALQLMRRRSITLTDALTELGVD